MSDYQKIFIWFCDIYQLPFTSQRSTIVKLILDNANNKKTSFMFITPYAWLFNYFIKLVSGEIELENFMAIWDLDVKMSQTSILNRKFDPKITTKIQTDTILVIDTTYHQLSNIQHKNTYLI